MSIVRDCQHPRANHQHGTRNAYVLDKCRCRPCTDACAAYERSRSRAVAIERYHPERSRLVDAEPVREHIRSLSAAGMGWKRVARAARVANGTMYVILYGNGATDPKERRPPRKRIRRDIAERILAVRLDLANGVKIDATGSRRRLQALVALGYSRASLCRLLGILPSNATELFDGRRREVTVRTARAVAAVYDRLSMTPGPSARARRDAARLGYLVPAAWDDDEIDDPAAAPADESRPGRGEDEGRRRMVDVIEDWHDTWEYHLGDIDVAAARLGLTHHALRQHIARAQREGITVRRASGAAA